MDRIDPSLASGFRDYLPKDMIPRQRMFDIIRASFERFGFVPLGTPAIESEAALTGNDPNFKMSIFRTRLKEDDGKMALRFDLTVPLARVIAQYPNDIEKPFKRYQVGPVWRGEKAQAGRFREFVQFDADIVGAASMMADAEIVALMYETLTALGITNFLIRVNNRKVLNGLAEYAGFPAKQNANVLRAIDKLERDGWEGNGEGGPGVKQDLMRQPVNIYDESAAALTEVQAEAIRRFIELRSSTPRETLAAVASLMGNSPIGMTGVRELQEITDNLDALGIPPEKWTIDLSVARGLGYYTGPVFETTLLDLPSIGSVFSGGRYDDLVERFGIDPVPATGASIGVDRLFAALEQLKLVKQEPTIAKVLILNFDSASAGACQQVATTLRRGGIPTSIYIGREINIKGQLAYALHQEVPVVLMIGSSEREKGVVRIKDMKARMQVDIPTGQILDNVRQILQNA